MDIVEAARILGISVEAARKRVQRGQLEAYKVDGRWFVVLDRSEKGQDDVRDKGDNAGENVSGAESENVHEVGENSSRTKPDSVQDIVLAYQQLVESLRSEIDFLRQELAARTEENRRKDQIIAGLAQRIPELPSGDQELLKRELMNEVQSEIAATVQRLEERDRRLMELLHEIRESKAKRKGWWPWRK